jgi:hypothetical protein
MVGGRFEGVPLTMKSSAWTLSGFTGALTVTRKSVSWVKIVLPQDGTLPTTAQGASLGVGVTLVVGVAVAVPVAVAVAVGVTIGVAVGVAVEVAVAVGVGVGVPPPGMRKA